MNLLMILDDLFDVASIVEDFNYDFLSSLSSAFVQFVKGIRDQPPAFAVDPEVGSQEDLRLSSDDTVGLIGR